MFLPTANPYHELTSRPPSPRTGNRIPETGSFQTPALFPDVDFQAPGSYVLFSRCFAAAFFITEVASAHDGFYIHISVPLQLKPEY
jgi:hypothetical protein